MAKTAEGIKDDWNGAFGIRCGRFPDLVLRLFGKMWSEPVYQIIGNCETRGARS